MYFSDTHKLARAGGPESSGVPHVAAALPGFPGGIQDEGKSGGGVGRLSVPFIPGLAGWNVLAFLLVAWKVVQLTQERIFEFNKYRQSRKTRDANIPEA